MVISMISKMYIVQFLKNNQECESHQSANRIQLVAMYTDVLVVLFVQGLDRRASSRSRRLPPRSELACSK